MGDFEDRFEKGVWLGMTIQSGENIVGTSDGVYKVGGIMRRAPDQRWSAEMVEGIRGSPAEPRPGSGSDVLPTYVKHPEHDRDEKYQARDMQTPVPEVRPARITRADIEEHGGTRGCKACNAVAVGTSAHPTGGHKHSPECRLRFEEIFREAGAPKLSRADARMNEEIYRQTAGEAEAGSGCSHGRTEGV